MKSPCEEVVWDILPGIRAAIAEQLVKKGLSQKEVSRILGITPPAVSQYVSKKRGYSIELSDEVKAAIEKLAEDLKQDKAGNLIERMCEICRMLRGEEDLISVCPSERCS